MKIFILLLITFFIPPSFVYADSPYYKKGIDAVDSKDHINTIKYLFAFKVLNSELLKEPENIGLSKTIDEHIKHAEQQLKLSAPILFFGKTYKKQETEYNGLMQTIPSEYFEWEKLILDKQIELEKLKIQNSIQ